MVNKESCMASIGIALGLGYYYVLMGLMHGTPYSITAKSSFLGFYKFIFLISTADSWYFSGPKISITFCHDVIKFNLLCLYFKEIFFTKWRLILTVFFLWVIIYILIVYISYWYGKSPYAELCTARNGFGFEKIKRSGV